MPRLYSGVQTDIAGVFILTDVCSGKPAVRPADKLLEDSLNKLFTCATSHQT